MQNRLPILSIIIGTALALTSAAPAYARGFAGPSLASYNISPDGGLTIYLFGQSFTNYQIIVLATVFVGLFAAWYLYKRICIGECDCFCGPGKCECGCGCRQGCPCFYRNKEVHSDQARRTRYY